MKKLLFQRRWIPVLAIAVVAAASGLAYQNCSSKVGFSEGYSNESLSSASGDSDGIYYTNQKVVVLNVNSTDSRMNQMRASLLQDMDAANVPWIPVDKTINFDLGSNYAADGSLDGLKPVFIQLRASTNDQRETTTAQIFLDTQAPVLTATGLMLEGAQGEAYSKGDGINLTFTGFDKVVGNGAASGFNPTAGVRWGVTYNGDCSESSLSSKSDWLPFANSMPMAWPEADPAKTFYFCVYGRDRAGNIGTLLSQPMTELWRVIAGDNNQGNGGSVLAKSVRFGYPYRLAADSKGNVYVNDAYMNVIRRIGADGTVNLFAGTGVAGSTVVGPANASPISGADLDFDSKDQMYFVGSGAIWRILLPSDPAGVATIAKWAAVDVGLANMRIDRSSDTMYVSLRSTTQSLTSNSYILKIPISAVDQAYPSASTRPSMSALQAKYVFAGNGQGLASTTNFVSPATVLASTSVDYPGTFAFGDSGEVYYTDTTDGAAFPFGHQQVRMLKPDAKGILQNTLVTASVAWAHEMSFIHYTDAQNVEHKYLLVSTDASGLRKVDLMSGAFPVAAAAVTTVDPHPASDMLHPVRVGGLVTVYPAGSKTPSQIIVSESSNSRITVMNSDLSLSVNYGRPVYDAADKVATDAMVNNPDGVAQAKNGDIYLSEPLSHILRKVDSNGQISLVSGTPGKALNAVDAVTSPISSATISGYNFTIGFRYDLAYDAASNRLYMADGGAERVREFDLTADTTQTFGAVHSGFTADPHSWIAYSLAIPPANAPNHDLYVYRSNPYYPHVGANVEVLAAGTGANSVYAGNGTQGVPTVGAAAASALPAAATATAIDSKMNFYFSGSGGTFEIDAKTNMIKKISGGGFYSLQIVENNGDTHLFGNTATTLYDTKITAAGVVTQTTMCLSGTFLNLSKQLALSADGNLLIADTRNDRVLKYFINDGNGGLEILNQTCH